MGFSLRALRICEELNHAKRPSAKPGGFASERKDRLFGVPALSLSKGRSAVPPRRFGLLVSRTGGQRIPILPMIPRPFYRENRGYKSPAEGFKGFANSAGALYTIPAMGYRELRLCSCQANNTQNGKGENGKILWYMLFARRICL